jgi:hypothetical protein
MVKATLVIDLTDVELWPQPPELVESLGVRVERIEPGTRVAVLVRTTLQVSSEQSFALLTAARGYVEAAGFRFELVRIRPSRRRRWWRRTPKKEKHHDKRTVPAVR